MKQLVIIIIPLLVLILIGVLLFPKFSPAIAGVSKLADFDDCDKDKVQNYFDKCPCISAFGSEAEDLRGCPKGTSLNKSINDRQTCNWLITNSENPEIDPVESCGKDNINGCVLDADGNPKTRCGVVKESAIEVSDSSDDGTDPNAVTVTSNVGFIDLKVYKSGEPNPKLKFERGEVRSWEHKGGLFAPIQISGTINNTGNVDIVNKFNIEVSVCNSAGNKCQRKNMYDSFSTSSSGKPTGSQTQVYNFNGLKAGKSGDLESKYIFVGTQGDYCDGPGDPDRNYECVVKLSIKGINDVDKTDNEISFVFHYQDELYDPKFELNWYQLEFKLDEDNQYYGDTYTDSDQGYTIERATKEWTKYWDEEGSNHGHQGSYPGVSAISGKNCVVYIIDYEAEPDLGWGEVSEGFILEASHSKEIPLQDSGGDIADAVETFSMFPWKAMSDGDMICHNNAWYWCGKNYDNGLVVVGNDYFLCKNLQWIKRK